ncbi:MAG TPA: tRNA epoxyqueuosine(34) reductase QueG [Opitutaceae bacterium]|nr:tRNA epoxyqueuosine(34) reductase QueG [Opitutaceae bacterium]
MQAQQEELRRRLVALGFDVVRFARIGAVPTAAFGDWLARDHQADMAWMERTAAKRLNPELLLPGVRSVIMLGVNYWAGLGAGRRPARAGEPIWARYAVYEDYHDTMKPALVAAGRVVEELYGVRGGDYRYYVDTGPVLERGWAERAGIGFLGKNGMLISRQFGNWLLLAGILTRVELAADEPLRAQPARAETEARVGLFCGKCSRCIAACPTNAIPEPGLIDARRCISYQTIENKGFIPRELRPGIGQHIFGCDLCLEACPWNRFAQAGRGMLLAARFGVEALTLTELMELTPARFAAVFRGTPIQRLKWPRLLRNACVVAGNVAVGAGATHELVAPLLRLAGHPVPLVRAHAVWAVRRIAGADAPALLARARENETDPAVIAEYQETIF